MRLVPLILSLTALSAFAIEIKVPSDSIWVETVQRGDLPVDVRGIGSVTAATSVELQIPESDARRLHRGMTASIDIRPGAMTGAVENVGVQVHDGLSPVTVRLAAALPSVVEIGRAIDGTIHAGTLSHVLYLGRPVHAHTGSEGCLFRVDPDGQHATRVRVRFGQGSSDRIEVRDGLRPGDRVILSDTTPFQKAARLLIQ